MNATDIALIANIGEIIAAVLVVISLVYVALQIRQNTYALKITAAQTYVSMYNTITSDLAKPDIAVLWHKGMQDFANLEGGELVQFSAVAGQLIRVMESAYSQWQRGELDDQLWLATERSLKDTLAMPGFHQWWQFRKNWYSDDFRQLLDGFDISDAVQPVYPDMNMAKD